MAIITFAGCQTKEPGDLVLTNGEIYTMEADMPWAQAVVINGNKITAVLEDKNQAEQYIGENTKVIDLDGNFVMPGYIDGHTHFDEYGAMLNDIDLLPVSDEKSMIREIKRVVAIIPQGEWIVGKKWDAHRLWKANWEDREKLSKERWLPHRDLIDDYAPDNPCFFTTYGEDVHFANTAALIAAGINDDVLEGMQVDEAGRTTGIIYAGSEIVDMINEAVTPKSEERILNEMRAGLKSLAEQGIVEIQDITPEGYPELYAKLQEDGKLTCRVWMRPDLSRSEEIKDKGIVMNTHPVTGERDYFLRYGAFKGYMDGLMGSHGALLREPYSDKPETYGHYRDHSSDDPPGYEKQNLDKIYNYAKTGVDAGYIINVHAIGDKGIDLTLDMFEKLAQVYGVEKIARSRVIHAQTIHDDMLQRFKNLQLIAEVTPSNVQDDMRWIIRRLGPEREKLSHRYATLIQNGVAITGGSDIPGAQGATFYSHPKTMIHAVVNRTQDDGTPDGGWLPQEKISVHDAIKMFTIDAAYAAFDEDIKGSIREGKLADFTVCDLNLVKTDPENILKMNILMTIVDGKIVYEQ